MPNQYTVPPLPERFRVNMNKNGPAMPGMETRCWNWTGGKDPAGYGSMNVNGKVRPATHVLFYLRKEHWPPKGRTCNHHCDNPGCVNPRHLYLGTHKSNARDRDQRERNGSAKLTRIQVWAIRALYRWGTTQAELGRRFDVTRENIHMIVRRTNWARLPLSEHLL